MSDANPRYVSYARVMHGTGDLDAVLAADRARYPGGCMCGFILFIQEHLSAFRKANGLGRFDHLTIENHADFDAYLGTLQPMGTP
jgi:hypothetical protein